MQASLRSSFNPEAGWIVYLINVILVVVFGPSGMYKTCDFAPDLFLVYIWTFLSETTHEPIPQCS
jgi:hypothetical protein